MTPSKRPAIRNLNYKNLLGDFYGAQGSDKRIPLPKFRQIAKLLLKEKLSHSEVARRATAEGIKINNQRVGRIAHFLGVSHFNHHYVAASKSNRVSTKFPERVNTYLSLRLQKKMSVTDASKAVGVSDETARNWERRFSREQKQRLKSESIKIKKTHSNANLARALLEIRNPDGTFKFPPRVVSQAAGMSISAVYNANSIQPKIRSETETKEVAKRFVGNGWRKIPLLLIEARKLTPVLKARITLAGPLELLDRLSQMSENKKMLFEIRLTTALNKASAPAQVINNSLLLFKKLFKSKDLAMPLHEFNQMFPESGLLEQLLKVRTSDGTKVFLSYKGWIMLDGEVERYC
ncbi:MAG: hypothetical protein NTY48_01325 [Candidatus Diapherotrites archaeon]|nr:hypothetical protein [Candidatus Diapherotrites archaeon]